MMMTRMKSNLSRESSYLWTMGHIVRKRFEVAKLGEKEKEYSGDFVISISETRGSL